MPGLAGREAAGCRQFRSARGAGDWSAVERSVLLFMLEDVSGELVELLVLGGFDLSLELVLLYRVPFEVDVFVLASVVMEPVPVDVEVLAFWSAAAGVFIGEL
jgi:hypothetical protein